MLIVGAVFFIVSLYILSSFVWFVEVVSSRELKMVSKQQVLDAAAEYGIRRGALRFTIDNNQVGDALEKKFTEISWVGVEVRGTKVVIEVVEKVFPREGAEKKSPGNIVACKDGIVKELLVLSGEPKVAAGDTVRKGDILISGVIYPQDSSDEPEGTVQDNSNSEEQQRQSGQPVHVGARGIVRARVWYESRVQIPLLQHKEELTGKSRRVFVLRLGEKKILLKNEWEKDFQRYRREEDVKKLAIGKFAVPVDLLIVNYKEIEKKDIYHNMAEARKMAEEIAAKDMTSRLPEGAKVVSRKTDVSSADEKELKAVVYMETLENIAKFVPLE